MSKAYQHPAVRVMIDYLSESGVCPLKRNSHCVKFPKKIPLIVSLSGGVDSIVIASVLAYLCDNCRFSQLYIVLVHVDYGNRPKISVEASYVRRYSNDTLKQDNFVVRVVNEVTRGVMSRDEYEKIAVLRATCILCLTDILANVIEEDNYITSNGSDLLSASSKC